MEFKEEILNTLVELKKFNIDRRSAEEKLGYVHYYIDQAISKGGNKKLLNSLKVLLMNEKSNIVSREKDISGLAESYTKKRNTDKTNGKRKGIPFFDAEASAGLTMTEMTPIHAPAGTIDVGDLLHDSKAAIRIYGNSMLPNYPPGCVLGLSPMLSKMIEPGEVYVIETRDRRVFKRLFYKDDDPDSDYLALYSDNTMVFEGGSRHGKLAYPPFHLAKDEIIRIFIVTGVIKRNANSVIINR
jgi:hypothetical protein